MQAQSVPLFLDLGNDHFVPSGLIVRIVADPEDHCCIYLMDGTTINLFGNAALQLMSVVRIHVVKAHAAG